MKNYLTYLIMLVAVALFGGCTDDKLIVATDPSVNGEDSPFSLSVVSYDMQVGGDTRGAIPSEKPEPETEEERTIKNFWLYTFNASGNKAGEGKYYEPTGTESFNDVEKRAFDDLVKSYPGQTLTLYVVANVGPGTWSKGTDFSTLTAVKNQQLIDPKPICVGKDNVLLPMSGQLDNVTISESSNIEVNMTRMYAKVKVQALFKDTSISLNIYDVNISNIPYYCRTSTVAEEPVGGTGEPAAYSYPGDTFFISRAFNSEAAVADANGSWLTLYIPEVICGEVANADKIAGTNIPANPLTVDIKAKSDDINTGTGLDYHFKMYPGGNNVNNFNVERNCVYRVTADVRHAKDMHNPSANCFIVKTKGKVAFEPYNRDETGGEYNFSDYLNPSVTSKKIARVAIIWQTKDCIGNNSSGDLVYLGPPTTPARNQKIYVKTNKEGNALIGAYNDRGKIIWSWHIWVTDLQPDNLGNAVIYTTYSWDSSGIYYNRPRIPGYAVMPCNLGALAFRSEDMDRYYYSKGEKLPDSQLKTFGMMYQWGRKDPFPPMICSTGTEEQNSVLNYVDEYTETHYKNDNETIAKKTINTTGVFYSQNGTQSVEYGIANPTVFIKGSNDWCKTSDNKLWGGEPGKNGLEILVGDNYGQKVSVTLYDNYGRKSIFDPCPRGWRVSPNELWMSFTKDGKNPMTYNTDINFCKEESGHRPGLSMYMQAWHDGPTSYFPLQGIRLGSSGDFQNVGLCGNYQNATSRSDIQVNILHLHRDMAVVSNNHKTEKLFRVYEFKPLDYIYKSSGSAVRCVRETK